MGVVIIHGRLALHSISFYVEKVLFYRVFSTRIRVLAINTANLQAIIQLSPYLTQILLNQRLILNSFDDLLLVLLSRILTVDDSSTGGLTRRHLHFCLLVIQGPLGPIRVQSLLPKIIIGSCQRFLGGGVQGHRFALSSRRDAVSEVAAELFEHTDLGILGAFRLRESH